jgi:hypothetical protein
MVRLSYLDHSTASNVRSVPGWWPLLAQQPADLCGPCGPRRVLQCGPAAAASAMNARPPRSQRAAARLASRRRPPAGQLSAVRPGPRPRDTESSGTEDTGTCCQAGRLQVQTPAARGGRAPAAPHQGGTAASAVLEQRNNNFTTTILHRKVSKQAVEANFT